MGTRWLWVDLAILWTTLVVRECIPAWNGRSATPPRSCRAIRRQTAECSGSARLYPAACRESSHPSAPPRATCSAPAKVPPDVMPTKIPSFFARSLLQRIASALGMGSTWLIAFDVDRVARQFCDEVRAPSLHADAASTRDARPLPIHPGSAAARCRWKASAHRPARRPRSSSPAAPWPARALRPSACRRCQIP